MVSGYSGWGQRSPDFGHSSLGGPPPEHRQRRRAMGVLGALVVAALLAAVGMVVVRSDGTDDERVAAEIERRSEPPVLNEARLVEDRLELDVTGPKDAERYCLASPALDPDRLGHPTCAPGSGPGHPSVPLGNLTLDADELVGLEIAVTAHSTVPEEGGDLITRYSSQVASEPSEPVEIIDAR